MNRDEALKKSDEALQELAAVLRQGRSETLVKYLDMVSQFHQYSFGNCMLIYLQMPLLLQEQRLVEQLGKVRDSRTPPEPSLSRAESCLSMRVPVQASLSSLIPRGNQRANAHELSP